MLKSKTINEGTSTSSSVMFHTGGSPSIVRLNRRYPGTKRKTIQAQPLDKIRNQAGLTRNQSKIITGGIQSDLGRISIPSRYREKITMKYHTLAHFFSNVRKKFYGHH